MNKTAIENFIANKLIFPSHLDEKKLKFGGKAAYIKDILSKSSLRIGPMYKELDVMLGNKIGETLKHNEVITLIPAIGGFKNQYALSFPHIDWAEVMQLVFLLSEVMGIAYVHEPGIKIEFTMDSYAMHIVDNYKFEDIQIYVNEFRQMLRFVEQFLPENVFISMTHFTDFYNIEEMERKINKLYGDGDIKEFEKIADLGCLNATNDFVINGKEDFSGVSKNKLIELRRTSSIRDHIWLDIDVREREFYLEGGNRIPILHKQILSAPILPVKSYTGSDLQFWAANGAFENVADGVKFRLISPNQLQKSGLNVDRIEIDSPIDIDALSFVNVVF